MSDYDDDMGTVRDSDEEEDYSYSDDDVSEAEEMATQEENKYEIMTIADVKAKYEKDIDRVCDTLQIQREFAIMAMRKHNWNAQKFMEQWYDDPDAARKSVGMPQEQAHSQHPQLSEKRSCPVCFRDFQTKDMLSPGCQHFVCKECWKGYLKANITEKQKIMNLNCPALNCENKPCQVIAPRTLLATVASPEELGKLADFDDALLIETNSRIAWCPKPDCKAVAAVNGPPPKHPEPLDIECTCGSAYCFTCQEEAHRPVDCETVKQWNIKNSAESGNLTWILANTKPCPNCRRPIEKNQGCMHMTCSQCRGEFCWLCLGKWSDHGDATGGFYSCNKFERERRDGKYSEEEMQRKAAKESLERYTHYYERYHANDAARKEAERLLAESGATNLRKLSVATGMAESQLGFVAMAHKQIVQCRRVLKWTYAYGYYKFAPLVAKEGASRADLEALQEQRKEMEGRKDLFEFLQGTAEAALERLSDVVEKDLPKFYSREVYWRDRGLPRDEHQEEGLINNEFRLKQQEIENKRTQAHNFFERLVEQLEMGLEGIAEQFS